MEPAPLKARPAPPAATPERKPSPPPPTPEAAAAPRLPAYAQARLAISQPQDAAEQQADRIAAQVSRPASAEEPAEPVPTPTPRPVPPAPADATDPTEQRIASRRGTGQPLPEAVRADMASRFGHDFMAVRVHTDEAAAALCRDVQAHAFTVGADIFFAAGAFAPGSERGRELLAHELTHVVQQRGAVSPQAMPISRKALAVDPNNKNPMGPIPDPTDAAALATYNELCKLDIPRPKVQHATTYAQWAASGRLQRPAVVRINRDGVNQRRNWDNAILVDEAKVRAKLRQKRIEPPQAPTTKFTISIDGRNPIERTVPELTALLKTPTWDRAGSQRRFDVDHQVEYQVATIDAAVDTMANYELFDPHLNKSSGGGLMNNIRGKVERYLSTLPPYQSVTRQPKVSRAQVNAWLDAHILQFDSTRAGQGVPMVNIGSWSVDDINDIKPLDRAREVPDPRKGRPNELVLASGPSGFQLARLSHAPSETSFAPHRADQGCIAGLQLRQVTVSGDAETSPAGTTIGTAAARWHLPEHWTPATPDITLDLKATGEYVAYPDNIPALSLDFRGLSPVTFDTVTMRDGRPFAQGQLTPSIPILNQPVQVTLDGDDLTFSLTYSAGEIRLPVPGVTVDDATLSVSYSTRTRFGVEGQVFFGIPSLGTGQLTAGVSQTGGFAAEGRFDFDNRLFDRAQVTVFYRDSQFGGAGELGIDSPDKIRGIRSASLNVRFEAGQFSATGTVEPDLPGVEQAGLSVSHSEETGLVIGGTLALAANPAIRSGSIEVTVTQRDDAWKVAASGTAQPAIPGIDSELHVAYDDGAFTAEASGSFRRGMLSGTARLGATNRTLGADGLPGETAEPGSPLVVYGEGSATLQLSPWLQGTAGLRFDPNGEVTVSGEIGLPGAIDLFARQEIDRSLFRLSTDIPIVPGIVAEVGGGISAQAGIGPGRLEEMRIGIEYNPAHEEDTRIIGDARLNVPADAGLRLSARAGVGLGIPGASATGGLELGGTLGVVGAAEASVHIDWTPATGLQIDAEGYLHAEPRFRLDVSGYVNVEAAFWTIYEERWELAAVEIGSNLRVGVRFPIHYHEGEPFSVSTDDVVFEVPDVDPAELAEQAVDALS